jgi:hypothetical protein
MASDSMFVEPEITIKEETIPPTYDEDCFSDTSSEAPSGTSDGSAPTTTPQVDRAESMAYRGTREEQVRSYRGMIIIVGSDHYNF